jgi:hypothetical protein
MPQDVSPELANMIGTRLLKNSGVKFRPRSNPGGAPTSLIAAIAMLEKKGRLDRG